MAKSDVCGKNESLYSFVLVVENQVVGFCRINVRQMSGSFLDLFVLLLLVLPEKRTRYDKANNIFENQHLHGMARFCHSICCLLPDR